MNDLCPCCSQKPYASCCQPLHQGKAARTAEALMRSRYSAFVLGDMDYVGKTMRPPASVGFDVGSTEKWAKSVQWLGLKVIEAKSRMGGQQATVEFVASYTENGESRFMHERSVFKMHKGRWYYVSNKPTQHDPELHRIHHLV